jgi:hypothetical protein
VAVAVAAAASASAEPPRSLTPGEVLPPLRGEFLNGRDAELPAAARGRVALLALGFSYSSRFAVEEFSKRFQQEFAARPDVTFFEIPMIGGLGRLARVFIDRGMRRNTPSELHEHVITVYGGTGDWKARLGVRDEEAAYLVLLDRDGRVTWTRGSRFDQRVFDDLRDAAARLWP